MRVASNKKARHDYEIIKDYQAGIVLNGNEIKSVRAGKVNIKDSFIKINSKNEIFLYNSHISEYKNAHKASQNEMTRPRKLLLNKREILKLKEQTMQKGYAIVCLDFHFKSNYLKAQIALARGKKLHDKRQSLKEKDMNREIKKMLKYKG